MKRATLVVVCALLAAGCAGFDGERHDAERNTVAPALEGTPNLTDRPTPPLSERLPTGVEASDATGAEVGDAATGVDAGAVGLIHRTKLRRTSRTVAQTVRIRDANGTTLGRFRKQVRTVIDDEGVRALVEITTSGTAPQQVGFERANRTYWGNRTLFVTRTVTDGTVTYDARASQLPLVIRQTATGTSAVSFVFGQVNVTSVESVGRVAGRERFRLRGNASRASALGARNLTLSAVIDSEGIVRSYRFAYTTRIDGRTVRVVRSFRVLAVGATTAPPPDWVATAREQTAG